MQRPLGVTILAVLAAIGGILGILGGLTLLALSSVTDALIPGISGLFTVLAIVTIVISIGDLVFAYGAWGLKPWAWTLGIALEAVGIVVNILEFRSATATSTIVGIVIAAAIIYYLYQPHVRRAFNQTV